MQEPQIILKKVKVHNLKSVDLTLNHNELIVFTGVSGSGKSSLAFDTIYMEGQRRYVESLSTYARRHLGDFPKPDAELISGISPTIAIEQKSGGKNPRSTVGTMTGIYDFMRVLYARVGIAHCPVSGEVVKPQSTQHILHTIRSYPPKTRLLILSPVATNKKGEFREEFQEWMRKGYLRARLDGAIVELNEEIQIDGKVAHTVDLVIDRLSLSSEEDNRLVEAVTQALEVGQGLMSVLNLDEEVETLFSQHAYSPKSGLSYGPLEPSHFSFNHPSGMCPTCQGLGVLQEFDLSKIIDPELSIAEDCCSIASSYQTVRYGNIYNNLAKLYDFNVKTAWKNLSERAKKVFLYGIEQKWTRMRFVHPLKKSRWTEYVQWKGVLHEAKERFTQAKSEGYKENMRALMQEGPCPSCHQERIKPYPAATILGKKRIAQVTAMTIREALHFFQSLVFTPSEKIIAEELLKEIVERLNFLMKVGLHYLCLERTAPTLSGGEAQRVRLASQIGSGLVGATYVLDEPSIGLHPRDNLRLVRTLQDLKEKGNTVIVVEHDEETIYAADTIVDVGPGAGQKGGEIVVQGSIKELLESKQSVTGAYLSGRKTIPFSKRRSWKACLTMKGASHHNLKGITVEIPLQVLVAVTGVSGSGKSSLITDTLYPALANQLHRASLPVGILKSLTGIDQIDKVIAIDQTPIGRTPRSNPATFIKLFDEIRELFSNLPQSIAQGYTAGRFSFNIKEGSCPHCHGMGMIKIDMDFMEDEWAFCEQCEGQRFDSNTLSITYRGKNIYEILEMTVDEAAAFFSAIPHIERKLSMLQQVGLNYIKLGQPSPTLSGGEAQRVKLAKELVRPSTGHTFYILDEPTTGLHFEDINKLVQILQMLVEKGNTVLVIEHNMDLVKTADWILDLGPEGGAEGGELVAAGTPEAIAKCKTPTGAAIKAMLNPPKRKSITKAEKQVKPLQHVTIQGACQNNLQNVTASFPRGKITVCTGPSGSGKSSFAFETVYAEGQRRYIESMSSYARQFVQQCPKPKLEWAEGLSPAIAIEQKSHAGNPRSTVGTMTEAYDFLRVIYAYLGIAHCPETAEEIRTISKEYVAKKLMQLKEGTKLHILSPLTLKVGETFEEIKERLQRLGFLRIRLNEEYFELDEKIAYNKGRKNALFLVVDRLIMGPQIEKRLLDAIEQAAALSKGMLVAALAQEDLFFNLSFAVLSTGKSYPPITPHTFSFNTKSGMCPNCEGLGFLADNGVCPSCHGDRLQPLARFVTLQGKSIAEACGLSIDEMSVFVESIEKAPLLEEALGQLKNRLHFLQEIGLGYLSLERSAPTLSGGEAQRIRLARQLGSGLTGCLYVLDEPTIGLHPHDNQRLNTALRKLCSLGNTLLLVEHDFLSIAIADKILDFGPGAGREGGKICASGSLEEIKQNPHSLTGAYLSGRKKIPLPRKRRSGEGMLYLKNATLHNLKECSIAIPTKALTCITGPSGSGKSTLLDDILKPAAESALKGGWRGSRGKERVSYLGASLTGMEQFDQLLVLDQNPIGHTNRADISTYVDLFTTLRQFFASLPEAKARGLMPGHFSFNHPKGMCKTCSGLGMRTVYMQLLPPVKITCESCQGFRLNPLSLKVTMKGKHLGNILEMSVDEAASFLPSIPKVVRILAVLRSVGLGYLQLGQEIATLSGGEAQRIRLSRELSKRSSGNTLYLLDEPTVGLHSEDIAKLLIVFEKLIEKGNTLVIIEHNLDVMASADHIIDMGPGSGVRGGRVVATGTPEEIARHESSVTAPYLLEHLQFLS